MFIVRNVHNANIPFPRQPLLIGPLNVFKDIVYIVVLDHEQPFTLSGVKGNIGFDGANYTVLK